MFYFFLIFQIKKHKNGTFLFYFISIEVLLWYILYLFKYPFKYSHVLLKEKINIQFL